LAPASDVEASDAENTTGIFSVISAVSISNIQAKNITYSQATVSWLTDVAATSQILYDTMSNNNPADYRYQSTIDALLCQGHSVTLTGLSADTVYYFRIKSTFENIESISSECTFVTWSYWSGGVTPKESGENKLTVHFQGNIFSTSITGSGTDEKITATSLDGSFALSIPANTIGYDQDGNILTDINIQPFSGQLTPPPGYGIIGIPYDFTPDGATFNQPLTITMKYSSSIIDESYLEDSLVIAYYDKSINQWVKLDCVIDKNAKTVTAYITHFTPYALLGEKAAKPVPTTFTVRDMSISPEQVYIGDKVNIKVMVNNTGTEADSYTVTLKINGITESTQTIMIEAGSSKEVTFSTSKNTPGIYMVAVDQLTGSFTVVAQPVVLSPAIFSVSGLSISPETVKSGESVTIHLVASNTGGDSGIFMVTLRINGTIAEEKDIMIAADSTQEITFYVTKQESGNYSVDVNGLTGNFTIITSIKWYWVISLIGIAIVAGLIVIAFLRRKRNK